MSLITILNIFKFTPDEIKYIYKYQLDKYLNESNIDTLYSIIIFTDKITNENIKQILNNYTHLINIIEMLERTNITNPIIKKLIFNLIQIAIFHENKFILFLIDNNISINKEIFTSIPSIDNLKIINKYIC